MKAVFSPQRFQKFAPLGKFAVMGIVLCFLSGKAPLAQAENHFLGNIPLGTNFYPTTAHIGVDTPTTIDNTGEFVFDGVADFYFDVTGTVQIWRSGPLDNFNDPITGAAVGVAADGLNTLRLEMVDISNVNVVATNGAVISSVKLGDGITGGNNDGALFSTGGAAEIGPDGATANAFLNLFMDVTVDDPSIPIPAFAQAGLGLDPEYDIGSLHNNDELHLEAVIDQFAPQGISFMQVGGPVGFFAPTTNQLVQDLAVVRGGLTEMRFAQFVSTDLQIVPEPSSIAFGLISVMAFGTFVWRKRRRVAAA